MTKKIALIFGGLGQNGYLLSKFLIKKKYKIYSIIKSNIKSIKIVIRYRRSAPGSGSKKKEYVFSIIIFIIHCDIIHTIINPMT